MGDGGPSIREDLILDESSVGPTWWNQKTVQRIRRLMLNVLIWIQNLLKTWIGWGEPESRIWQNSGWQTWVSPIDRSVRTGSVSFWKEEDVPENGSTARSENCCSNPRGCRRQKLQNIHRRRVRVQSRYDLLLNRTSVQEQGHLR